MCHPVKPGSLTMACIYDNKLEQVDHKSGVVPITPDLIHGWP